MWGWPSSCYRVQFNIPLNCSALSTKCEGTGKSSVHSSSPLFFSTAAKQSHAQEKGGNWRCREECVKASVSIFSKDFSFECLVPLVQLCWAPSKKGRNSHQRMCQSLGIPMPKFSISTVSISHGSSLKEWKRKILCHMLSISFSSFNYHYQLSSETLSSLPA